MEKLATTESSVADMQQELIALQPQLEVSTRETEAAMVVSFLTPCGGVGDTQDTAHMWHSLSKAPIASQLCTLIACQSHKECIHVSLVYQVRSRGSAMT